MKIQFEVDDEYMPLSGVAVLSCSDGEGHPVIAIAHYNDIRPTERIGLLAVALDQERYGFVDREGDS